MTNPAAPRRGCSAAGFTSESYFMTAGCCGRPLVVGVVDHIRVYRAKETEVHAVATLTGSESERANARSR